MKVITRAAISGKIATIKNGKRIVQKYESGEKLNGVIVIDDTPKIYRICERLWQTRQITPILNQLS